jgi:hypothetical protein
LTFVFASDIVPSKILARIRNRKSLICVCIVLVAFAAFVRAVPTLPPAILTPLWLVSPAIAVTLIRSEAARCDEQPVSLLSLLPSRAPPLAVAVA